MENRIYMKVHIASMIVWMISVKRSGRRIRREGSAQVGLLALYERRVEEVQLGGFLVYCQSSTLPLLAIPIAALLCILSVLLTLLTFFCHSPPKPLHSTLLLSLFLPHLCFGGSQQPVELLHFILVHSEEL